MDVFLAAVVTLSALGIAALFWAVTDQGRM